MNKFHLVLLIHSHQPVGNFDHVIEETYQNSYLPFVQALMRYPHVRVGLHYTGPLLEWCERHHPEFFEYLATLASRGQVELVGGGFYEPILISIPPEDQAAQIRIMREYLASKFGRGPIGAWLAERVWEPQLPFALSSAGVEYTLVDDIHFLAAGFEYDQLFGDYVCEDRGQTVRVFPGLKALRYLLPFHPPEEAIDFLHQSAAAHPGAMAAMGDDCEKFGAWPGTYNHCYIERWVDRFFEALDRARDWLVTTPPGEYIRERLPLGQAALPTASYSEMMEWALPTRSRVHFREINQQFSSRPDVQLFLRGGTWRGFFTKYPESNLLHKKMMHVSRSLAALRSAHVHASRGNSDLAAIQTHLLRAQCNDAYWHGVFGGLYAPHLRTELWRELVRAESFIATRNGLRGAEVRFESLDFDADGSRELYVTSPGMAALFRPSDGATLAALDFRPAGVTLINSIQRRPEAYHTRLREAANHSGGVASIHDQVRCKEDGLERYLRYDRWPRHSFRLLLFSPDKTFDDYQQLTLAEDPDLAAGAYTLLSSAGNSAAFEYKVLPDSQNGSTGAFGKLHCVKQFSFHNLSRNATSAFRLDCDISLDSVAVHPCRAQLGIEIVINLLAPTAPDRYFETHSARHPLSWAAELSAETNGIAPLRLVDEWQNVAVKIGAPGAARFWIAPIETVSESEGGFERVYQGSQILAIYPVELLSGRSWRQQITLHVEPAR